MRSFTPPADTRFYAGVDLHARTLFLVVIDSRGRTLFASNLPAAPEPFLCAVAVSNGRGARNERVSGPVGALTPAQPPCSAERGRRSPHGC
jgi:hypothetical protein